ncbi:MAG: response regulator [Candidatus Melainabacteria bacterium]|nr:response regulator [Candidatus Melainabacteria bacterium]
MLHTDLSGIAAPETTPSGQAVQAGKPLHVLLVEDDPAWQQAIAELLKMHVACLTLDIAAQEVDAMHYFTKQHPDLVLLDYRLANGGDGLHLASRLLQAGFSSGQLLLISGSLASELPEHSLEWIPKTHLASRLPDWLATRYPFCFSTECNKI